MSIGSFLRQSTNYTILLKIVSSHGCDSLRLYASFHLADRSSSPPRDVAPLVTVRQQTRTEEVSRSRGLIFLERSRSFLLGEAVRRYVQLRNAGGYLVSYYFETFSLDGAGRPRTKPRSHAKIEINCGRVQVTPRMNRPFIDARGSLINNAPHGTRERAENSSRRRAFEHATFSDRNRRCRFAMRPFSPRRLH